MVWSFNCLGLLRESADTPVYILFVPPYAGYFDLYPYTLCQSVYLSCCTTWSLPSSSSVRPTDFLFYAFFCLSLSVCLSLSLSLSVSLCASPFARLSLPLSLSLSPPHQSPKSVCLCLSISVRLCVCVRLSVCLLQNCHATQVHINTDVKKDESISSFRGWPSSQLLQITIFYGR